MDHSQHQQMTSHQHQEKHRGHYKHLLIMAMLSFVCMYALMYAMVDTFSNVFMNINQFYMAGLMTMPMIIIEVVVMSSMYKNKKLNAIIIGISCLLLIGFFIFIRQQTAVGDKQFLRSMIPHHAGAILMCDGADLKDPEIKELCNSIRESQQKEIEQMKAKLEELKNKQDQ